MVKTNQPTQKGRLLWLDDTLHFAHEDWDLILIAISRIIESGRLKVAELKKAK